MQAEDCCTTRSKAARSEPNFAKLIVSTPTKSPHNFGPIGLSRPSSRPRDRVVHTSAYQIAEFSAPSDAEDAAQGGSPRPRGLLPRRSECVGEALPRAPGVPRSNPGRRGREAAPTSDELSGCRSTDDKYTSDILPRCRSSTYNVVYHIPQALVHSLCL